MTSNQIQLDSASNLHFQRCIADDHQLRQIYLEDLIFGNERGCDCKTLVCRVHGYPNSSSGLKPEYRAIPATFEHFRHSPLVGALGSHIANLHLVCTPSASGRFLCLEDDTLCIHSGSGIDFADENQFGHRDFARFLAYNRYQRLPLRDYRRLEVEAAAKTWQMPAAELYASTLVDAYWLGAEEAKLQAALSRSLRRTSLLDTVLATI